LWKWSVILGVLILILSIIIGLTIYTVPTQDKPNIIPDISIIQPIPQLTPAPTSQPTPKPAPTPITPKPAPPKQPTINQPTATTTTPKSEPEHFLIEIFRLLLDLTGQAKTK